MLVLRGQRSAGAGAGAHPAGFAKGLALHTRRAHKQGIDRESATRLTPEGRRRRRRSVRMPTCQRWRSCRPDRRIARSRRLRRPGTACRARWRARSARTTAGERAPVVRTLRQCCPPGGWGTSRWGWRRPPPRGRGHRHMRVSLASSTFSELRRDGQGYRTHHDILRMISCENGPASGGFVCI